MSLRIKRIAGGMGVEVLSRRNGEPQMARTVEDALIHVGRSVGVLGDEDIPMTAQEVYELLDSLLSEPPTQIVTGVDCA